MLYFQIRALIHIDILESIYKKRTTVFQPFKAHQCFCSDFIFLNQDILINTIYDNNRHRIFLPSSNDIPDSRKSGQGTKDANRDRKTSI